MLTTELIIRQKNDLKKITQSDPFIQSPDFINKLHLLEFSRLIVYLANQSRPSLPTKIGGRPKQYRDESVLVVIFVMSVWQWSPEYMVRTLNRWQTLAEACGFENGNVISSSQLRRRRDALGLWTYFVCFVLIVIILIRKGVIIGRDWVVDATILDAFSKKDQQAGWSFTKRYGYKIHAVICRDSLLPLMILPSSANAHDVPWGNRLLLLTHRLFSLPVEVVRADSAYFSKKFIGIIIVVLNAIPKVTVNPRKKGKKQVVTEEWVFNFRQDRGKRGYIERFFAVLKRYYRLNELTINGLWPVYRHALESCFAVLLIALLAHELDRPELMHLKSRMIAPC